MSVADTIAWQQERGLSLAIFPYPPPAALLFRPFALLPLDWSFWVHGAVQLACGAAAGALGASLFGLRRSVGVLAALAWSPLTGAIVIGQNTPFALLLATMALAGLAAGRWAAAGLAAGVLLYKPTIGVPLAGLFVLRGAWRAVAVVALVVAGWYLAGVVASGGLVTWPHEWLSVVAEYFADDAARNADKAVSLPGLLSRLGVPDLWAFAAGVVLAIVALPRLLRAALPEAGAGALLVGVAASPHAWGYDAALVLPIVWWALAGGIAEPWRTRLIAAAYLLGPLWLVSRQTVVSAVAIVVLGAYAIWVSGRWRADASDAGWVAGERAAGDTRSS